MRFSTLTLLPLIKSSPCIDLVAKMEKETGNDRETWQGYLMDFVSKECILSKEAISLVPKAADALKTSITRSEEAESVVMHLGILAGLPPTLYVLAQQYAYNQMLQGWERKQAQFLRGALHGGAASVHPVDHVSRDPPRDPREIFGLGFRPRDPPRGPREIFSESLSPENCLVAQARINFLGMYGGSEAKIAELKSAIQRGCSCKDHEILSKIDALNSNPTRKLRLEEWFTLKQQVQKKKIPECEDFLGTIGRGALYFYESKLDDFFPK